MSEPMSAEKRARLRMLADQGHYYGGSEQELADGCFELLAEIDRLTEALQREHQFFEAMDAQCQRAEREYSDAEADLADEKRRHAAGVEEALESLDLLCAAEDTHGDTIRAHEVRDAVSTLRALLSDATTEPQQAPGEPT